MGVSTVCEMVAKVMMVLWKNLQPYYIKTPDKDEFLKIARQFHRRWDFPHCIGAIDCRHIAIIKPAHSKKLYFNWKKFHSIKLQAVVDANYRFIFIEVGDYGSTHDSTTFKNSKLYEGLNSGKLMLPDDDKLPQSGIILPYYIIEDGAYMLQEHLLKPYRRDRNLYFEQTYFNKRLSGARMVVECAFGHLVRLCKIFRTTMEFTPDTGTLITKCACLLRNIIIDEEGENNDMRVPPDFSNYQNVFIGGENDSEAFIVGIGKEVREELTKYLMKHPN